MGVFQRYTKLVVNEGTAVKVTGRPPVQIAVWLALMLTDKVLGAAGTTTWAVAVQPEAFVTVTEYVPAVVTSISRRLAK